MSNGSSGLDESASVLFAYAAPEIEQSKVLFDEDQHDVTIFYSLEETLVMSPGHFSTSCASLPLRSFDTAFKAFRYCIGIYSFVCSGLQNDIPCTCKCAAHF
jgi:hypothetical protein